MAKNPFYNFKERAKLYTAHLKAQAKFNLYKSDTLIQQFQIDYLEALSKSSLSPEEQHEKYAHFQEKVKAFGNLKYDVYTSEYCTSGIIKDIDSQKSDAISAALKAEQAVRNLLKDIQQPHAELRNKIAANLHYRDVQLRNPAKTEDERATLKSDISVIRSFQATGGLDSLTQPESTELNALFKDATTKYNAWKKESAAFKPGTTVGPLHEAEQAFKEADAAVMTTIRELGGNLKGPPELRKNLVATLRNKEALQASATGDEAAKLNEEIATLKAFLSSRQLAALDLKKAEPLTDLFREADKQYANWQRLETAAKDLDAAAQKATEELSKLQPTAAPKVVVPPVIESKDSQEKTTEVADPPSDPPSTTTSTAPPKAPTKEEEAQTKAKQLKMEVNKVLVDKATQARADATQAKRDLDKADKAIMDKIETLLSREMSKMLPSKKDPSNISRIDTDYDEIEEANLNLSSSPTVNADGAQPASSQADLASLKAFAEKSKSTIQTSIDRLSPSNTADNTRRAELENQLTNLTKLLGILNALNPLTENLDEKISSLAPLVDQMKAIEGKNKERDTARTENPTAVALIVEARTKLENAFLADLQELFPAT